MRRVPRFRPWVNRANRKSVRLEAEWTMEGSAMKKFGAIEGLRGWLVWAVVFSQLAYFSNLSVKGLGPALKAAGLPAVLVFLMISGFVITHLVIERPAIVTVARWPRAMVCVAVVIAVVEISYRYGLFGSFDQPSFLLSAAGYLVVGIASWLFYPSIAATIQHSTAVLAVFSFSTYLCHLQVIAICYWFWLFLFSTAPTFLGFPMMVVPLTIIAAELLYRGVERPGIALGSRLARRNMRVAERHEQKSVLVQ